MRLRQMLPTQAQPDGIRQCRNSLLFSARFVRGKLRTLARTMRRRVTAPYCTANAPAQSNTHSANATESKRTTVG